MDIVIGCAFSLIYFCGMFITFKHLNKDDSSGASTLSAMWPLLIAGYAIYLLIYILCKLWVRLRRRFGGKDEH